MVSRRENEDDILALRHKELIKMNQDKFGMLPTHVANFVYTNLKKGLLQDMFRDYESEADEKKQNSLYEVLAMYIQVY